MNEQHGIEKKLTHAFIKVAAILGVVAVAAAIIMIIVSQAYSSALVNYGFAQGDIGTALYQFAEARSSLRAAIGFDDETAINNAVAKYEENKALFEESFAQIENTIISKESRKIYDEI